MTAGPLLYLNKLVSAPKAFMISTGSTPINTNTINAMQASPHLRSEPTEGPRHISMLSSPDRRCFLQ